MLDVVRNESSLTTGWTAATEPAASPELALLSRQTRALEYIASQLGVLSSRGGQPIEVPVELQPDYELATRRLLQEAV